MTTRGANNSGGRCIWSSIKGYKFIPSHVFAFMLDLSQNTS